MEIAVPTLRWRCAEKLLAFLAWFKITFLMKLFPQLSSLGTAELHLPRGLHQSLLPSPSPFAGEGARERSCRFLAVICQPVLLP